MSPSQCPLAYPDKFHAAVKFWNLQPSGAKALTQENQLLLYALNQQATVGPNKTPRPWGWNVVETTKWQGWKELGTMSPIEAMRLFVKVFEEEQTDWWTILQQAEQEPGKEVAAPSETADDAAVATHTAAVPAASRSVPDRALLGLWTQLEVAAGSGGEGGGGGKKPLPRYESGAAVVGNSVYVLGGNYGGRYLADVWALDLASTAWSPVQLTQAGAAEGAEAGPAPFPPTAGHTVTPWECKLFVLGGHTKAKGLASMTVRVVDPTAHTWSEVETKGETPSARGGHTATLLGSKLWVFGGEDSSRRALGDVHVLDMETLTWSAPDLSGKAPAGRSACCATALQDRYIVLFGGGSVASCFNDVHLLDTQELAWSQPEQVGAQVSPRAGHSGAVLGDIWYIVGGGNNVKGCADLLAADLSGLVDAGTITWHVVTSVALRDPLSSEGISLVVLPSQRVLLAFGGYNGKYQNTVSLFRAPEGSAALLAGAAAAAAMAVEEAKVRLMNGSAGGSHGKGSTASESAKAAADDPADKPAVASPRTSVSGPPEPVATAPAPVVDLAQQVLELKAQLEAARREAESAILESAAAKEGAAHELSLLRKQLAAAQAALAEANKALENTRTAVAAEQAKVLKLEAQSAELQSKLGQLTELEKELEKYRRAAREAAEAAAKKGGGFWGYLAGGSSS